LTAAGRCRIINGILPKVINLLQRIEEMLATERLRSDHDLVRLVEDRLPTRVLDGLRGSGLADEEIYSLILPRRTLTHRLARREPLSLEESDRVVRLARIAAFGEGVFGDPDRFWRWMRAPKTRYTGRTPLQMLATEAGARLVEEFLGAIDHGFAA
jgi:putative toxin-antitoxin system antitoxin component (TIGR02293 family)